MEQASEKRQRNIGKTLFRRATDERRLLQLYGEHSVIAYGCRRILLYTQEEIQLLRGKDTVLRILGDGLCCTCFSAGAVTVQGRIRGVLFETVAMAKQKASCGNGDKI